MSGASTPVTTMPTRPLATVTMSISSGTTTTRDHNGRNPLYGSTGRIGTTNRIEFVGPSILVARVGANAGSVYVVNGAYGVTDNTLVIRPGSDQNVSFLTEVLQFANLNRMVYGSGQPLVTGTMLKHLEIPDLPAPDQSRIADALDDAGAVITALEQLIAKKEAIKQGMMQRLLTGLDNAWPLLPIAAVATVHLGGNYKNSPQSSSRPLIKMGNIARININLSKVEYIPDSERVSEQHRLHYGDVLFNTRNTLDLVGKVSIWRDELPIAYYNSNILRLEFRSEYCGDSQYFGYALNSKRAIEDIRTLATGTTSVAAVYTRDLLKLEVPVPPRSDQAAIAAALSDIDSEITTLQQRLTKARDVKTGMMQELLTGRTRLPVREAAS